MLIRYFSKIKLILITFLLPAASFATDTLCTAQEQVIFSCSMGKKIASVCASRYLSPTHGYIQYRLGKKSAIELMVPHTLSEAPSKIIRANTMMYSGGGGAYIRLLSNINEYIVYTAIGKGWKKSGIVVEDKKGTSIQHLLCQGKVTSELGSTFFEKAQFIEDPKGFETPE